MSQSEALFLNNKEETQTQPPSTPKKKPRYKDQEKSGSRRVKSITKLIQKQSTNTIYSLLVFIWSLIIIGVIIMTFQNKIKTKQINAVNDIEKCKQQYQKNRCDNPPKLAIPHCNQMIACMNADSKNLAQRKISYPQIFGQITKEFASGAGLIGISFGVVLIWLCMRQKGKERIAINVQYYDDK